MAYLKTDFYNAVAQGNLAKFTAWHKTAYSPTVNGTESDIWALGGIYVPPVSGIRMQVVSTNNTNDKAGGTGALQVTIYYLDDNFLIQSEIKVMNGTTPVLTTATNIYRIQAFLVTSTGSTGKAAGNISVQSVAGTVTYDQIEVGFTRARNSIFTVPTGYTLYISEFSAATGGIQSAYVRIYMKATYNDISSVVTDQPLYYQYAELIASNGSFILLPQVPIVFPAQTDVKVSAISSASAGIVNSVLRGYLLQD
jgi:hypothetical protein